MPCPCAGPWGRSPRAWLLASHNSIKGIGVIDFALPAASRRLSRDQDLREQNKGKINSERCLAAAVPEIWALVLVSLPAMEVGHSVHSWGSALSSPLPVQGAREPLSPTGDGMVTPASFPCWSQPQVRDVPWLLRPVPDVCLPNSSLRTVGSPIKVTRVGEIDSSCSCKH